MDEFGVDEEQLKADVRALVTEAGVKELSPEALDWFETVYANALFQNDLYRAAEAAEGLPQNKEAIQKVRQQARNILRWLSGLEQRDPTLYKNLRTVSFGEAVAYHDAWFLKQ